MEASAVLSRTRRAGPQECQSHDRMDEIHRHHDHSSAAASRPLTIFGLVIAWLPI